MLIPYLVIVESPSKCKTIEGYLGDKYKVIATCGHFRALNDLSQINDLDIKYSITKSKILKMLKEEIMMSKNVILATDNDREGESIAWHICDACKLPLTTPRIIFHEITRDAIQKAISTPTIIDMNKVYSQMSRQVLDLYIGFTISPILWKYIQHKLSAGRCQTPALKMLYEREQMIQSQTYETKYKIVGFFPIEFKLVGMLNKEEVVPFLEACKINNDIKNEYTIEKKTSHEVTYSPPSILITSTLQQRASQIGMSPKQTMMCAQTLYEHGLITYMRTETSAYSTCFIEKINKQISLQYGKEYIGDPCSNVDTHEGIRVTNLKIERVDFESNVNKLYEFIYKHTFQSCMSSGMYIQTPYEIQMPMGYIMRYVSSCAKFEGWKIVKTKSSHDECEESVLAFDFMKKVKCNSILAKEQCEHLLLHYTESQLIQRLEKENIGRPSTYTSILDSVEKYVTKGKIEIKDLSLTHYTLKNEIVIENENKCIEEKNKLKITELGEKVTSFCYKYFDTLFDYSYTKDMETYLDNVGDDWKIKLREKIDKIKEFSTISIDEIKPEYNSLHCGLHKKYPLIIKDGPHGFYLEYKKEKTSLKMIDANISEWVKDQLMNEERMKLLIDYMIDKNVKINDDISIRKSERGYYIFYKTSKMKKPKFFSFPNEYMDEEDYRVKIKDYIEKKYKLIC